VTEQDPPKIMLRKAFWLPIAMVCAIPLAGALVGWGVMSTRIETNAQQHRDNQDVLKSIPEMYVPRTEIDAKLETIDVKIDAVQKSVDTSTIEIIRRIERLDGGSR